MNKFDILLVLGYFRSATAYLSLIRHCPAGLRIGIIPAKVRPKYVSKTPVGQAHFLNLCRRFGAEIIDQGTPVETRLLVVQQFPYPDDTVAEINATVRADRRIGLLGLTLAGLETQDRFLAGFGIRRALVPNRRLFQFLLERRGGAAAYAGVELVQVGLPYKQYPVFPEFGADYIIASPTTFNFRTEAEKHAYLANVLGLCAQMPASSIVVYKSHNGVTQDYFAPPMYTAVGRFIRGLPVVPRLIAALAPRSPKGLRRHLERVHTAVLHLRLLERVLPMPALTPDADISIEAFLPHVRHGVIGGLSNTIWGTLYFGLTYYNCVDSERRSRSPNELLGPKDPSNFIDLNVQFFGVPYCHGDLGQGSRGHEIVTDADRTGDFVAAVLAELDGTAGVARTDSLERTAQTW